MHIDDWLGRSAKDEGEKWAKEFLGKFRRPAIEKCDGWIEKHALFCTYNGERWRVLGASRLGDVWLTKHFERVNGYDIRPDVDDCSEWSKTPNVGIDRLAAFGESASNDGLGPL